MTTAEDTYSEGVPCVNGILTPRQYRNFWAKVNKSGHPHGCWEWTGTRHYKGYGLFGFGRKIHKSHRVAFRLTKGEIADGLCVCHKCDNPPCVNPDHLFLGTHKDNTRDKIAKGRDKHATPERNGGGGKLGWQEVRAIRGMYAAGEMSQQAIADKFGVSQILVSVIVRQKIWKE